MKKFFNILSIIPLSCILLSLGVKGADAEEAFRKKVLGYQKLCEQEFKTTEAAMIVLANGIRDVTRLAPIAQRRLEEDMDALHHVKNPTPQHMALIGMSIAHKKMIRDKNQEDIAVTIYDQRVPGMLSRRESIKQEAQTMTQTPSFVKSAPFIETLYSTQSSLEMLQQKIATTISGPFRPTQRKLYETQFKQVAPLTHYYFNIDHVKADQQIPVEMSHDDHSGVIEIIRSERIRHPQTAPQKSYIHSIFMSTFHHNPEAHIIWSNTKNLPIVQFLLRHEVSHCNQMHLLTPRFEKNIEKRYNLEKYYRSSYIKFIEVAADYEAAHISRQQAYAGMVYFAQSLLYDCLIYTWQSVKRKDKLQEIIKKASDIVFKATLDTTPTHPNSFERFLRCAERCSYEVCLSAFDEAREMLATSNEPVVIEYLLNCNPTFFQDILNECCTLLKQQIPPNRDKRDFGQFSCTECPIL